MMKKLACLCLVTAMAGSALADDGAASGSVQKTQQTPKTDGAALAVVGTASGVADATAAPVGKQAALAKSATAPAQGTVDAATAAKLDQAKKEGQSQASDASK